MLLSYYLYYLYPLLMVEWPRQQSLSMIRRILLVTTSTPLYTAVSKKLEIVTKTEKCSPQKLIILSETKVTQGNI